MKVGAGCPSYVITPAPVVLPAVFFQDGILREKQGFGRLLIQDAEPDFQQIVAYGAGIDGGKSAVIESCLLGQLWGFRLGP